MRRHPTRRQALGWFATGAASALSGCLGPPHGEAVPYVDQPPEVTPGVPRFYATSLVEQGLATGVLVESHEGRPTKVEGNPLHPASLGATGVLEQAAVVSLYDPDRGRSPLVDGKTASWEAVRAMLRAEALPPDGQRVHVLLEPFSSPTRARLLERLRARLPGLTVHVASPHPGENERQGLEAAYGGRVRRPELEGWTRIASFDSDFLREGPLHLRHARRWARRRVEQPDETRMYAVETGFTLTGAKADERLPVAPSRVQAVFAAFARSLLAAGHPVAAALPEPALADRERRFVGVMVDDLRRHRGLVLVGARQPAWMHAVLPVLDRALDAPVRVHEDPRVPVHTGMDALLEALAAGRVDTLLVLGGDPATTHVPPLDVLTLLPRARRLVYAGPYAGPTALLAHAYAPTTHDLEQWGDARAADGTVSLQQPLVEPLFGARSVDEILGWLVHDRPVAGRELVRRTWRERRDEADFDRWWRERVQLGLIADTAFEAEPAPAVDVPAVTALVSEARLEAGRPLELSFRPSYRVGDGRWANNPWLQEMPDPLTQLTWGNAAHVGTDTGHRYGLHTGQLVRLRRGGAEVVVPVLLQPGHAEGAVTVELGYGLPAPTVADGVGVDVSPLRGGPDRWWEAAELEPLDDDVELAFAQRQDWRQGRETALHSTVERFDPTKTARLREPLADLYEEDPAGHSPMKWGMAIDMTACIGCSACLVACQAENNIPSVGPEEVERGRRMHWLRVDRYWDGEVSNPTVTFQPMLCQHCADAPCEYVCPTYATAHSPDGLNEMIYNRCIGTRFCSNNCPYKIRRFNWFEYSSWIASWQRLQLNPDVTVRGRGVMEKCTFCVQRIRQWQRDPAEQDRPRTACEQACPTEAITFGDVTEARSEVSRRHASVRAYEELHELGTKPRVRYLVDLRHPNPALQEET